MRQQPAPKALRSARKGQKLSGAEMAGRLGISLDHLYGLESGTRMPSLQVAAKIERVVGVPASSWVPLEAA